MFTPETLNDDQVTEYKGVLKGMSAYIDMALSGLHKFQDRFYDQAFISSCQNASVYFDHLNDDMIRSVLHKILKDHCDPVANDVDICALASAIPEKQSKVHAKLKSNLVTVAEARECKIESVNAIMRDLTNLGFLRPGAYQLENFQQILTELVGYQQELRSSRQFYETWLAILNEQPTNPLFDQFNEAISNLIGAADGALSASAQLIWHQFALILLLELEIGTIDVELLTQKKSDDDFQAQRIAAREAALAEQQALRRPLANMTQVNSKKRGQFDEMIAILLSLQHPRPEKATKDLRDYCIQLQVALTQVKSLHLDAQAKRPLINLVKNIRLELQGLQCHLISPTVKAFEVRLLSLLAIIDNHPDHIQNGLHAVDVVALTNALAKMARNISRLLPREMCPLRMRDDFELIHRTSHYADATNNRTALGTMSASISEFADKHLSQQLLTDVVFLNSQVQPINSFCLNRINDKIKEKIFEESAQGGECIEGLVNQLRQPLKRTHFVGHRLLDRISRVVCREEPFQEVSAESVDTLIAAIEAESEHFNAQQKVAQLIKTLRELAEMLQPPTFDEQKNYYQGNAQNCILDYCQWLLGRCERGLPLSKQAMTMINPLMASLINQIITDLNVTAGNAAMIIYGPQVQRTQTEVDRQFAQFQQQQRQLGQQATRADFLRQPSMQKIYHGQEPEHINMGLEQIPRNLFTLLTKATLWYEFVAMSAALKFRKPDDLSTDWMKLSNFFSIWREYRRGRLMTRVASSLFARPGGILMLGASGKLRARVFSLPAPLRKPVVNQGGANGVANGHVADDDDLSEDDFVLIAPDKAKQDANRSLANGHAQAKEKEKEAETSSDDDIASPSYQTNPELILDPADLLRQLHDLRDKLETLMPLTMDKYCPHYGVSSHQLVL